MSRFWQKSGATKVIAIMSGASVLAAATFALFWSLPYGRVTYSSGLADAPAILAATTTAASAGLELPDVTHIATPEPLKAVYMTACTASVPRLRAKVLSNFDGTELNAAVIDLKDYTGTISYASTTLQTGAAIGHGCRILDLPAFLAELHARGIYAIARITVFQDPLYASQHPDLAIKSKSDPENVWRDKNGLAYLDPSAKPYWDYITAIGREAYGIGFDELNFDYIRFPSDGDLSDMLFTWSTETTKTAAVTGFFKHIHEEFASSSIPTSADLFGLTTSADDDMGIGQVLTDALPYFDFVAPMVYPSHFAHGYIGFAKPAEDPYEVIKYSMSQAVARAEATTTRIRMFGEGLIASTSPQLYAMTPVSKYKLRPWLQAFDLGAVYTPAMVRSEIQATYDSGLSSWMLWNAASIYNKEALAPAPVD